MDSTYACLQQFTYDGLEQFTYGELETCVALPVPVVTYDFSPCYRRDLEMVAGPRALEMDARPRTLEFVSR